MVMRTRKNESGFTLIEIVVSLFIIGSVTALYAAASSTLVLVREAKNQEIALRIAQGEMDTLRSTPYVNLPASGPFTNPLLATLPNASANVTLTSFNSKTQQIVATVNWVGPTGTRNVSLTTLLTQGGIGQ